MLELKGITKNYETLSETVKALKGIDLCFRKNEFVSILGPSGCGKTTLLNIIGGLDQYTTGDLSIDGISTKQYKDRDWDSYRNHKIGFVFQSYNLIPHQTVLANVELALSLSGVSKQERRKRAKSALEKVGLGDQLKKRPNQMSGGQMQRVAIARALVNDPDIILADEPTGALDTETSVAVMDILKEISKERLIIMVTHNPDIAESYSSRIIRMLDGNIIDDSNPLSEAETEELRKEDNSRIEESKTGKREKKPSLSFGTAFMLSLRNLFTKKGRTVLTSFAGSIGIIGIALILAVSQGTTAYIDSVQEEALSSYPLTLQSQNVDLTALMENFMSATADTAEHSKDAVYRKESVSNIINAFVNTMNEVKENDLKSFDNYIRAEMKKEGSELSKAINGIQYSYNLDLQIYTKSINDTGERDEEVIISSDTNDLLIELMKKYVPKEMSQSMLSSMESRTSMSSMGMSMTMASSGLWQELLPANDGGAVNPLLKDQYDVVYGEWPSSYDEVVVVLDSNNEIDDMTLYALGFLNESEMKTLFDATFKGENIEFKEQKWSYEDICSREYRVVFNADRFGTKGDGLYYDKLEGAEDEQNKKIVVRELYNKGMPLKVTGIIRPAEDVDAPMLTGGICYTADLTEYMIKNSADADIIKAQTASPKYDVISGKPFEGSYEDDDISSKARDFKEYVSMLEGESGMRVKAEIFQGINVYNQMISQFPTPENFNREEIVQTIMTQYASMLTQYGMSEAELTETIDSMSDDELMAMIRSYALASIPTTVENIMSSLTAEDIMGLGYALDAAVNEYTEQELAAYYDNVISFSEKTYDENLAMMGYVDLDKPAAINIYASSFENKDVITDAIAEYNKKVDDEKDIGYTDYIGIMLSSVTTIINAITYVLVAFVSISLIVSSIMIGVITLISVQERTKEIGILRAIGASKKNVSQMFNAETMIIGFASGLTGVLVTYILCIPINAILYALTDITNLKAHLPLPAALILIAISVLLTLISGIIPSRSAAKKDPVVALRTE
ncbi:MAG: ABC transporter ATP-binding protein/permease [Ruminococcaceae bacterium]|nr:ABC transporter ATP-binding protein/permease [Oscillospiraceae bacterium]